MLKNTELFGYASLDQFLDEQRESALQDVEALSDRDLLGHEATTLQMHIMEEYELDVPRLRPAGLSIDPHEAERDPETDAPRIYYTVCVPYVGSPELFMYTPRDWDDDDGVLGFALGTNLCRQFPDTGQSAQQLKESVDMWLDQVKRALEGVQRDYEGYVPALRKAVSRRIHERQDALRQAQEKSRSTGIRE